jgi:hypothetical protein
MRSAWIPAGILVSVVSAGVVIAQSPATKASAETATPEAAFRVESANVDLGSVTAGDDAVATFIFHNDLDRDVKILRAAPS